VLKLEYWHRHRNANDRLMEECNNNFCLAFVKVLEVIPVGNLGEMIPRPELACCWLPTGNSAYEKASCKIDFSQQSQLANGQTSRSQRYHWRQQLSDHHFFFLLILSKAKQSSFSYSEAW